MHDYNELNVIKKIESELQNKICSLISDAGSPLISDPGYKVVNYCRNNNIFVTVIPGPSSLISALQVSSIPINKYVFFGFFPKSSKNIGEFIETIKLNKFTSIFFVSRHKILSALEMLAEHVNDRKIAICKELTKLNERVFVGNASEVLIEFTQDKKNELGEFVIVVDGVYVDKEAHKIFNPNTKGIIIKLLEKFSLTDTVEIVHKIGNIQKKDLYNKLLEIKNEK